MIRINPTIGNSILWGLILLTSINTALSIPVPLGIDGTVYDLDGITKVQKEVYYSITNINSGYSTGGMTRNSAYSATVKGSRSDKIIIRFWNKYNSMNSTLALEGVIHNADILLNMSYPPIAPNITSVPIINSSKGALYTYKIEAFDENDDILVYGMDEAPTGMQIGSLSGVISWIPQKKDIGMHNVSIIVSDGILNAKQSFTIYVANANYAPIINSTPITGAKVGKLYTYAISAYDLDEDTLEFTLEKSPEGMSIGKTTGIVEWRPKGKEKGLNNVSLKISDGYLNAIQEFGITVYPDNEGPKQEGNMNNNPPETGNSNGGGGGGGAGKLPIAQLVPVPEKSNIVVKTNLNDIAITIEELGIKPKGAKNIEKIVYKYIRIENINKTGIKEAEISFSVNKGWLERNRLLPGQITLNRYHEGKWQELTTSLQKADENSLYFTSKTPGFSYFAITVKDGTETSPVSKYSVSSVNMPYRVKGIIYSSGNGLQARKNTLIEFANLNNSQITKARTGIGSDSGAYYALIEGNMGDTIMLNINGTQKGFAFRLNEYDSLDFTLSRGFVAGITGFAFYSESLALSITAAIFLAILSIIFLRLKYNKR